MMGFGKVLWYPLGVLLFSRVYAQTTIVETVTTHATSTVTLTSPGSCLPLCGNIMSMFPSLQFSSVLANTSTTTATSSTTETSETETETETETFTLPTPTGTPTGFLVQATVGDDAYYLSYTADGVGLIPQTWGNATYWFLHGGYLRDREPPYLFLWLNPDLGSGKRDGVVVYRLGRSFGYDEATENPLDSLRQVSRGYSVRSSVDRTLELSSGGVGFEFAAGGVMGEVRECIAVVSGDVGRLEGYVGVSLGVVGSSTSTSLATSLTTTATGMTTGTTSGGVSSTESGSSSSEDATTTSDVGVCEMSAVASLQADSTGGVFCSEIYGWTTTPTATSTIFATATSTGSGVVTDTTTSTIGVIASVTFTSREVTLSVFGYVTSPRVSAECTGTPAAATLASRAVYPEDSQVSRGVGKVPSAWIPESRGRRKGNLIPVEVVKRDISTPEYFSGWDVTSISSACGCLTLASPETQVVYTTFTTTGATTTEFSTEWTTPSTTVTTSNDTISTTTTSLISYSYQTVAAAITQSFPSAQYSIGVYTATAPAEPTYALAFTNYNLAVAGEDLATCACGTGLTCSWVDYIRGGDYNMQVPCSTLNDCSIMCTNINYAYGTTNLCVGVVFYQSPRNVCVFKRKLAGLDTNYLGDTSTPGCGTELTLAGNRVTSGIMDFTRPGMEEWRYVYNYSATALDYDGNLMTYHMLLESSAGDWTYYNDDGTVRSNYWNFTAF
ncbi:hypothetical protein TWF481_011077 [Arthrobotrys musiformis]|uniref:Apple domain-containing protein n=1 Tax=Arthrobotrys musiformis TaxID=47236 RepID=A0AAV9W073_9PEZI